MGTLRQSYDDENVTVSAYYVRNCGSSNKMLKHFVLVADDTASRLRKCLISECLAYYSYKQKRDYLVYFSCLLAACWPGAQSV